MPGPRERPGIMRFQAQEGLFFAFFGALAL